MVDIDDEKFPNKPQNLSELNHIKLNNSQLVEKLDVQKHDIRKNFTLELLGQRENFFKRLNFNECYGFKNKANWMVQHNNTYHNI